MTIFAEIVLFCLFVAGIADYVRLRLHNKVLSMKVESLTEKNTELLELITSDDVDRLGIPPAGKRMLHG